MKPVLTLAALLLPILFPVQNANAGPLDTLKFGGQIRARGESRNQGANYSADAATDIFYLRTRLNLEATPAEGLTGFIELQDSRTSGSSSPGAVTQKVDLHQGYLDVEKLWQLPLSFRAGRWSMDYGSKRMISSLDWSNIGRSWDGIRLSHKIGDFSTDLFVTNLTESGKTASSDELFSGLWTTYSGISDHAVDAYLLVKSSDAPGSGDLDQRTLGFRVARTKGNLTYGAELAGQWGKKEGNAISAYAGALDGAYTFDAAYKPELSAEYAYASGDKNPTDTMSQRFDPLFPFGHFYHGFADLALWSNMHTFKVAVAAKPFDSTWGQLALHHFRLAQGADSWRSATGAVVATDTTATTGRSVGTEVDLHFKTTVRGSLKLWYGYSHFIRGQYAKKNLRAGSVNMNWLFAQAVLNF